MDNQYTTTKSKTPMIVGGLVAAAIVIGGLIIFTDLDLTKTGEMPSVKVEAGELPEFDVDVAKVKTGTKTIEVEVPTVDVDLPKEGPEADDLGDNIDIDVDADIDVETEPEQ